MEISGLAMYLLGDGRSDAVLHPPMNRFAPILLTLLALAAVGGVFWMIHPFLSPVPIVTRAPEPPSEAQLRPYEELMDKTLAGYNTGDAAALFAGFASTATPAPTPEIHRALFEDYYKATFGKCNARKLYLNGTEVLPDRALLTWNASFEKASRVRISANYVRENGDPKIVQLRFEGLDPATN